MSGIVDKTKDILPGNKGSSTAGPHDSNVGNKTDPRVDSDRDASSNMGLSDTTGSYNTRGAGVTGSDYGSSGGAGLSDTTGTGYRSGDYISGNPGPHSSNLANKGDPRVDSDRDGSRNMGLASNTTSGTTGSNLGGSDTYGSGTTGGYSSGTTGSSYGTGNTGSGYSAGGDDFTRSTNAGPHDSNITNKVDPRVDSDRDGSRNVGLSDTTGNYGSNTSGGYGSGSGTDAGVGTGVGAGSRGYDSGTGTRGGTDTGVGAGIGSDYAPGPAPNTAGPHKSDLLNKMDPRVDSDRDGSKTVGGNKTYQ